MAEINGLHNLHTITTPENYDAPIGEIRSTCRRGTKWMDLRIDTKVILTVGKTEFERNVVGEGIIVGKEYMFFEDLNDRHIKSNHSKFNQLGIMPLFQTMKEFYGDDFNWDSQVTILFYRRIS